MDDSQFNRFSNDAPISTTPNYSNNYGEVDTLLNVLDQLESSGFGESNNNLSKNFMEDRHQQTCVSDYCVQTSNSVLEGELFKNI